MSTGVTNCTLKIMIQRQADVAVETILDHYLEPIHQDEKVKSSFQKWAKRVLKEAPRDDKVKADLESKVETASLILSIEGLTPQFRHLILLVEDSLHSLSM
jgi:hypothetical protein